MVSFKKIEPQYFISCHVLIFKGIGGNSSNEQYIVDKF